MSLCVVCVGGGAGVRTVWCAFLELPAARGDGWVVGRIGLGPYSCVQDGALEGRGLGAMWAAAVASSSSSPTQQCVTPPSHVPAHPDLRAFPLPLHRRNHFPVTAPAASTATLDRIEMEVRRGGRAEGEL